jgi:hypothetical protein
MIVIVGIRSVVTVVAVVVAAYCIAIRDFIIFRGIGVRDRRRYSRAPAVIPSRALRLPCRLLLVAIVRLTLSVAFGIRFS